MGSTTEQVLRFGAQGLRKAKPINWFGPVQEEVNKTPQPLRVNVQLTNGKRSASVSSSASTGIDKRRKVFVPKASGPKKPHQKGGFKGAKKPGSRK
jgi:hypothetical protein